MEIEAWTLDKSIDAWCCKSRGVDDLLGEHLVMEVHLVLQNTIWVKIVETMPF